MLHINRLAAASMVCVLAVSACGGSGDDGGSGGSGEDITLGLVTSISGNSSGTFASAVGGADARLKTYVDAGGKCADRTIKVIEADDQSSPQGALAATQKLVQQDKVFAVLETTPFFYGASQWSSTTGKKVPVFGAAFDGAAEWTKTDNNLFGVFPVINNAETFTDAGDYFKAKGGTKVAAIAYDSPSAKEGLQPVLRSAEAAGLKRGYINDSVPFGSTDVGTIVLGIIDSGSDVVQLAINPETSFGIVAGLKQAGYKTKVIVSATGYGNDLLESAPAVQAAQGVSFQSTWQPSEIRTPATDELTAALKKYAGSKTGVPGFAQAMGWFTADLFLHSLELAGCDATQEELIASQRKDDTWDGNGLMPVARDFSSASRDKECVYYVTMEGEGFVPDPDGSPICGDKIED